MFADWSWKQWTLAGVTVYVLVAIILVIING